MRLDELRVIVTGAARGMGRGFVTELARAGARVAACDLEGEALAALAADAPGVAVRACDVTREEEVAAFVAWAADALGGLNALVNNAGIFRDAFLVKKERESGELRSMALRDWQAVLDVDLTGPFLLSRALAERLVAGGAPGVIVNISSISRHGNIGQGNYAAAKAGLVAATESWARELSRHRIRVGAVAPGFVDTPMLRAMPERMLARVIERIPLGRLASIEEVWLAVRFIFECDYFTGRVLDVDGGLTL